jgi:ribosomal protein S12 methylthiotransferase accessory factor YcaO
MGMSRQEAGSKGGKETLKRYGRAWMRELGKRGIQATANKYFAGSVAECMSYLRKKAAELQIAALADEEGRACVEVPILLDPDIDPFFEEPSPTWQQRLSNGKPTSMSH